MEEALVKRILPHSSESERAVVGSMMMDADAIAAASEIIMASCSMPWWNCIRRGSLWI